MARVLLVEPNDHLRRVFRRRFAREGFELVEASDGESALGAARAGLPDLIVAEGSVRDSGGVELSLRLASDPELRRVPLIVLAARSHWDVDTDGNGQNGDVSRGSTQADELSDERGPFAFGGRAAEWGVPCEAQAGGPRELTHPFRPGRLVEIARGVLLANGDGDGEPHG